MAGQLKMKEIFRIGDWWQSKAALLIGLVYLYTAWFEISFEKMIWLSLLSISTVSGFASVGYLCNDFFDREKDFLVEKKNFLLGKSPLKIFLLFLIALLILFLPWLYLPFNKISILIIAIELVLFVLYSVNPFRFKERGAIGIFTDALYAHVIPALLSAFTFMLAASKPFPFLPMAILLLWQLASGIRNILLHQHEDADKDSQGGMQNFASRVPVKKFSRYVKTLIFSEIFLSVLFLLYLSNENSLFIFSAVLIFLFSSMVFMTFYNQGFDLFLQTRWKFFPNPIFEKWLPITVLVGLSHTDKRFLFMLLIHITLFNFNLYIEFLHHVLLPLKNALKYICIQSIINMRRIFSFLINYSIYCGFLIFGVDLKKENSSALGYLKKLRNAK